MMPASASYWCASPVDPHVYIYTLRFSVRCFLVLMKKSLFLEVPIVLLILTLNVSLCTNFFYKGKGSLVSLFSTNASSGVYWSRSLISARVGNSFKDLILK